MLIILAIMFKLTSIAFVFLLILNFQDILYSQEIFSEEFLTDEEFSNRLSKELSQMNSEDRFNYVSDLLDELIMNRIDRIVILNELYSDWVNSTLEVALLKLSKGCFMYRTGEIDSAVIYLNHSSEILRENGRFQLSSESYNELGNAYFTGGRLNMAVNSYLNSLKVGHDSDDETAKFNAFLGLGRSYCAAGDTVIGVKLLNEYLRRSRELKKMEASSDACGALAVIYQDIGDKQMSDYYYKKGHEYSSKSDSRSMQSNSLTNRAIVAFNSGKVDSAYLFFQNALQLRVSLGSSRPIVDSYFNLASFKIMLNEYTSAKSYIDTAMMIADENGLTIEQMDLTELLMEVLDRENNQTEVEKLRIQLDSMRNAQEINSEIDPISTGVVSVMLNRNETLPIDPQSRKYLWIYQTISVLTLLLFSLGILYFSTRKI